ncbi:MAG TPA: class I SAM-dependent methyltransferase [Smithellaceae bacterium]|nr:class I SAM-dependent methyltransferase [Smithellaceae bacterium]
MDKDHSPSGKRGRPRPGSDAGKRPGRARGTTAVPKDVDPRVCGLRDAVKRGWYRLETGELFAGFQVAQEDVALDVGCGEGNATLFCARQGAHVVFSDSDAEKIKALAEKMKETNARKFEAFVSDSLPLPLPDAYATKILCTEMLEHTPEPEKIMAELVRVGKPNARYLITVPDARSEKLQTPVADPLYFSAPNHIQIFDRERFLRLVKGSGLSVQRYDTWGFYWTVFMSLFWIVQRQERLQGAILDNIKPPYHPVLQNWANTWAQVMELEGSDALMESFDQCLPKTQVIVAEKR